MSRFQFFPDLTADEFAALKSSISERGVDVPVIVDQKGEIIDGFHRQKACDDLGTFCPREIREFSSDADKFELALALNCRRRQLNREQKRELIGAYLRRDPQIADNHLAETIGGISKNTVADVRADLEATCQIDKFERHRGRDGKVRPTKYKRIIATSPKAAERALAVISDLPDSCLGTTLDITTAKRRASRNRNRRAKRELGVEPFSHETIKLFHCRFQDLAEVAGVEPGKADLWFTDIPYVKAFVEQGQVEDLGAVAASLLKPGGVFITYSGQYWLPEIINGLSRSLTYRWTGASLWRGQANSVHAVQVRSKWKPLVIFSNGDWKPLKPWVDVHHGEGAEKRWHKWQQPLRQAEYWIERFSHQGDLVIDGCGGGFTTAIACYRIGRRCISCPALITVTPVWPRQSTAVQKEPLMATEAHCPNTKVVLVNCVKAKSRYGLALRHSARGLLLRRFGLTWATFDRIQNDRVNHSVRQLAGRHPQNRWTTQKKSDVWIVS